MAEADSEKDIQHPLDTTDPKFHDPNKFRYVVHALATETMRNMQIGMALDSAIRGIKLEPANNPAREPDKFVRRSFFLVR